MTDDTNIVSFRPRPDGSSVPPPPPPPLPPWPMPRASVEPPPDSGDGDEAAPSMPRLPGVEQMAPPLALTMPAVPTPDPDESGDDDGSFAVPVLGDPDQPTARGTLAVAMALMTAMGVAAAQGMWHRARHRQALADQSRAAADRTKATASGHRASRGAGSSGGSGSLLRSPGGGSRRSRAVGGHGPTGHGSTSRGSKTRRPSGVDAAHGPHRPIKGHKGTHKGAPGSIVAPKAGRDGKRLQGGQSAPSKLKRAKGGHGKSVTTPKPTSTKGGPSAAPVPRLTWKAPKGGGNGKRPTRWTRQPGTRRVPTAKRPNTKGAAQRIRQARRVTWQAQKGSKGPKRWTPAPPSAARKPRKTRTRTTARPRRMTWKARPKTSTKSGAQGGTKRQKRWTTTSGKSARGTRAGNGKPRASAHSAPPPPPGFEGMRPPPGADRRIFVVSERLDNQPPRPEAVRSLALAQEGPLPMLESAALPSTQYRDAELTIFDVIDAAADMAEEITDGVVEAQRSAAGCDALLERLEALHAKVVELRVPGSLEGMVVALMEQTAVVKARAEAIAENLPRAAEAISIAGSNAEARHRPLADAVRDAGHTRPAERDYHQE